MKEYKFRGKEIDTGKWVYGGLFKEPAPPQCFEKTLEDKYWIVYSDPRYMPDWNLPYKMVRTDVNKETIGQYTRLKDKDGKEIYEGDIVKIHKHNFDYGFKKDEIGQIKFIDGAFGFYREESKNEYYFNDLATESGYRELEYYEVIGNIYDNPELLEELEEGE